MKKAGFVFLLTVLGCALSSQAVVIGWAGENAPLDATSAILVYVPDGSAPQYDGTLGNLLNSAETVGTAASGDALYGGYIFPQETEDTGVRSGSGKYYVVLFKGGYYDHQYAVSTTSLNWDDPIISTGEMDPISDYFTPPAFGDWGYVPEPSTAMLLVAGAAVAALRRRKRA